MGDAWYGDDPTVNRLQELAAEVTGKAAAVFLPTGTMANQIALRLHVVGQRPPRGLSGGRARRHDRGDDLGGALGHRVPHVRPGPARMGRRRPGPDAARARHLLRRRDGGPVGGREHGGRRRGTRDADRGDARGPGRGPGRGRAGPPRRRAPVQRRRIGRRRGLRLGARGRHVDVLRLQGSGCARGLAALWPRRPDAGGPPAPDPLRRRLAPGRHRGRRGHRGPRGGTAPPARGPRARASPRRRRGGGAPGLGGSRPG